MMLSTQKQTTLQSDAMRYGAIIVLFLISGIMLLMTSAAQYPEMIAMAYLSFTMGLRHAFDVDHIAAIDNMTRKMLMMVKIHAVSASVFHLVIQWLWY